MREGAGGGSQANNAPPPNPPPQTQSFRGVGLTVNHADEIVMAQGLSVKI